MSVWMARQELKQREDQLKKMLEEEYNTPEGSVNAAEYKAELCAIRDALDILYRYE